MYFLIFFTMFAPLPVFALQGLRNYIQYYKPVNTNSNLQFDKKLFINNKQIA